MVLTAETWVRPLDKTLVPAWERHMNGIESDKKWDRRVYVGAWFATELLHLEEDQPW